MKRFAALAGLTLLTALAPAWATVVDVKPAPAATPVSADSVKKPVTAVPAVQPELSKEEITRRRCAVARYQHDQLYKAGAPDADERVDVRAACEPDAVASEAVWTWVLVGALVLFGLFMLPMMLMGMAPG